MFVVPTTQAIIVGEVSRNEPPVQASPPLPRHLHDILAYSY